MIIIAALIALLSQANGQTINCLTSPNYKVYSHQNVPDPTECRRFYQCDNANNGFPTLCGDGTIFNYPLGSCSAGIDCDVWRNRACYDAGSTFFVPNRVMNFSTECCTDYYQYLCPALQSLAGAWYFRQCDANEVFNPTTRRCELNPGLATSICGKCAPKAVPVSGCEGSYITVINNCSFYKGNFSRALMSCPQGTMIDRTTCRCDLSDPSGVCGSTGSECTSRYLTGLSYPTEVVTNGEAIYPNEKNPTNNNYLIPFFQGNGISTGDSTQVFSIGFTIDPNTFTSEVTVVSQTCTALPGLTLTLKVSKASFNSITLRFEISLSGTNVAISSNSFGITSTDQVTATVRLSRGTTYTRRRVVGSYQVNLNPVVDFPSSSPTANEFEAGYWQSYKDCPFSVGNVRSILKLTYTQCKK